MALFWLVSVCVRFVSVSFCPCHVSTERVLLVCAAIMCYCFLEITNLAILINKDMFDHTKFSSLFLNVLFNIQIEVHLGLCLRVKHILDNHASSWLDHGDVQGGGRQTEGSSLSRYY